MKYLKVTGGAVLFMILSCQVFPQADTLVKGKPKLSGAYLSGGFAAIRTGLGGVISGTFLLSNNWGVSVRYNPNAFEAKNMPDDYIDIFLGFPLLTNGIPTDNINIFSFNAVREFHTNTNLLRFGIEFGPAFIKYEKAIFTPDENYIPWLGSNYIVTHEKESCIGFSVRGKIELPLTRFIGLETAPYVSVNKLRSFIGFDFILTLGWLR